MRKFQSINRALLTGIAAATAIGGLAAMSIDSRTASADNTSSSVSAKASSSSSSSSSASSGQKGDCQATATAEVTTTVNGVTKTVRQENSDRGCSANAKAKAAIDDSQPEDSTPQ